MDTCPAELYGDVRDNQEQQEGLSQASRTQDSRPTTKLQITISKRGCRWHNSCCLLMEIRPAAETGKGDKLANPGWNARLQFGDVGSRNGDAGQQVVGQDPIDCVGLSPHLLISEFTRDLLNRLYWSRTPNINCDQTKYAGSSNLVENLF